jgi:NAD(P)-dependent dehydrogenase (short-subunit alcohol dehydrogenase family)
MAQSAVLVVGASRGIGAGLVDHYLGRAWVVHATVRNLERPGKPADLPGDLVLHELDVRNEEQTAALAEKLRGGSLDVIIHNAGIYRGFPRDEIMAVNTEAPIRIVETLLHTGALRPGGVVAIVTSQMGSRRGRTGSLGDYGDSKATLNDEFRRRADDWRTCGALAIVVHPGWVRTDMGGPSASISVDESVDGIARLIDGLTPDQHGRFWAWDGRELPW